MSLPRLQADFVARRRGPAWSWVIAVLGVFATGATLIGEHALESEAAGLELRLEALRPARAARIDAVEPVLAREARAVTLRLATPWGGVLDDLEAANRDSGDSIAVLSVQPDRETRRVTLMAEARSLPAALNYVQRLQRSKSLRHPLLDSHEVRNDSPERPVRVQISAEWKLPS